MHSYDPLLPSDSDLQTLPAHDFNRGISLAKVLQDQVQPMGSQCWHPHDQGESSPILKLTPCKLLTFPGMYPQACGDVSSVPSSYTLSKGKGNKIEEDSL